jgi:hypothetical protein
MSTFYNEVLNYYELNGRRPMSHNLLTDRGGRRVRASDANIERNRIWTEQKDDFIALLNSTFHSYELDRQMPLWWFAKYDLARFMEVRDSEINKGQGRVEKNHMYKEAAYRFLIEQTDLDHGRLIMPNTEDKVRPMVKRK